MKTRTEGGGGDENNNTSFYRKVHAENVLKQKRVFFLCVINPNWGSPRFIFTVFFWYFSARGVQKRGKIIF
jgi:hypothetical protein